jgi:hypothetical protein
MNVAGLEPAERPLAARTALPYYSASTLQISNIPAGIVGF